MLSDIELLHTHFLDVAPDKIQDGVCRYDDINHRYWGEISKTKMQALNLRCREIGWGQALEEIKNTHRVFYNSATEPVRSDISMVLPVEKDSLVLDIGSGLGAISSNLSQYCKEVVSFESTWERIEFQALKCKEKNNKNITFVCSDALRLPFPFKKNTFNLAVLNGVFEWLGTTTDVGSPMQIQQKVLQAVFDLLAPEGNLYIGIENRFGMDQLLGAKDPHGDFSYTAVLPRVLSSRVVNYHNYFKSKVPFRKFNVRAYRTYTYSYWGLKSMLKKAGFQKISIYAAFPSYSLPMTVIDLQNSASLQYYLNFLNYANFLAEEKWSLWLRRLSRFSWVRYFVPHFIVIAQKNASIINK